MCLPISSRKTAFTTSPFQARKRLKTSPDSKPRKQSPFVIRTANCLKRSSRRRLKAAVKVLKGKEQKYASSLGVSLGVVGLSVEKYDVSYPSEAYQKYQAFETGDAYVTNNQGTASRVVQRKGFTFFYDPFEASSFDSVLAPLGLEPAVQFSLYLRVQYEFKRPKLN